MISSTVRLIKTAHLQTPCDFTHIECKNKTKLKCAEKAGVTVKLNGNAFIYVIHLHMSHPLISKQMNELWKLCPVLHKMGLSGFMLQQTTYVIVCCKGQYNCRPNIVNKCDDG